MSGFHTQKQSVIFLCRPLVINIYLKVGMNQWSALSPLLFVVVTDVVPSEEKNGIPSELLCADALVFTTPIMELKKGQKVNAGQSNGW